MKTKTKASDPNFHTSANVTNGRNVNDAVPHSPVVTSDSKLTQHSAANLGTTLNGEKYVAKTCLSSVSSPPSLQVNTQFTAKADTPRG